MKAQPKDPTRRRIARRFGGWRVAAFAPLLLIFLGCGPAPPEDIASPPLASRDDLKPTIEGHLDIAQDIENFLPDLDPPNGGDSNVGAGRTTDIDGPSTTTAAGGDNGGQDDGGDGTQLVAKPVPNGGDTTSSAIDLTAPLRAPKREARRQLKDLPTILFEYNSYALSKEAQLQLDRCSRRLKSNPELQVLIEGHTDERGTTEYNYNLGAQRAAQAREFLIKRGISPARLFLVSYGEERPTDPASTPAAWKKNRRIEFFVY